MTGETSRQLGNGSHATNSLVLAEPRTHPLRTRVGQQVEALPVRMEF
jgi:hypothetical protein